MVSNLASEEDCWMEYGMCVFCVCVCGSSAAMVVHETYSNTKQLNAIRMCIYVQNMSACVCVKCLTQDDNDEKQIRLTWRRRLRWRRLWRQRHQPEIRRNNNPNHKKGVRGAYGSMWKWHNRRMSSHIGAHTSQTLQQPKFRYIVQLN